MITKICSYFISCLCYLSHFNLTLNVIILYINFILVVKRSRPKGTGHLYGHPNTHDCIYNCTFEQLLYISVYIKPNK